MPFDKKFWISFVAVLVVSMLLGFVVHGAILASDYEVLTSVMRPAAEQEAKFGFMVGAHFVLAFGLAWLYRGGRDADKPWLGQGVRFGHRVRVGSVGADLSDLSHGGAVPARSGLEAGRAGVSDLDRPGSDAGIRQQITRTINGQPQRRRDTEKARRDGRLRSVVIPIESHVRPVRSLRDSVAPWLRGRPDSRYAGNAA